MNFSNLISVNWFKNYNNWLPILQWSSWVVVTLILVKIFWIWVLVFTAPSDFQPIKVEVGNSIAANNQVDVNALLNKNLFGAINQAPQVVAAVAKEFAETKLNLTLRGIYATDNSAKANAIVEDNRGKQAVYFIGEKLDVSGRVYLRQVFIDRVILETNGVEESLTLAQEEMAIQRVKSSPSREPEPESRVRDERNNSQLSEKLSDYRNKLLEDPTSVADVISGRPHFVDGELQGIAIQPGKDKRLFQELGLRNDDIVTSINGIQLTNMADAMSLMSEADSLQELNVEIQRDGEPLNLLLNLNDRAGKE